MRMKFLVGALFACVAAVSAQAALIPGLYDTGIGANGSVDTTTGIAELHYVLNGSSTAYTISRGNYKTATDAYWIAPSGGGTANSTNVYTLTFDLTGFDLSTAVITGSFAADDEGTLKLNNGSVIASSSGYSALTAFTITSGFVAGLNTLTFTTVDTGTPPTSLLVSGLHGTATAVPEPANWALMIAGFALVGVALRRRRETAAFA